MKNNRQTLVTRFEEKLIAKLENENIIITTDNFNFINKYYDVVNKQNKLNNITVYYDGALTSIRFLETWKHIPLVLYVNSIGSHRMFFHLMPILRQMNVRIFLSNQTPQNFVDLQIMASLGICSGIYFSTTKMDWNKFADLQTYAIYSKNKHAAVEPFNFILSNYKRESRLDFNTVYYNDPQKFLHLNAEGQIALNADDLKAGKFVLENISLIDSLPDNQDYIKETTKWQQHFLDKTHCAECLAWRICLGKFVETIDDQKSCANTMTELLDGVEHHQQRLQNQQNNQNQQKNRR